MELFLVLKKISPYNRPERPRE